MRHLFLIDDKFMFLGDNGSRSLAYSQRRFWKIHRLLQVLGFGEIRAIASISQRRLIKLSWISVTVDLLVIPSLAVDGLTVLLAVLDYSPAFFIDHRLIFLCFSSQFFNLLVLLTFRVFISDTGDWSRTMSALCALEQLIQYLKADLSMFPAEWCLSFALSSRVCHQLLVKHLGLCECLRWCSAISLWTRMLSLLNEGRFLHCLKNLT
jgi:hypothetical protein